MLYRFLMFLNTSFGTNPGDWSNEQAAEVVQNVGEAAANNAAAAPTAAPEAVGGLFGGGFSIILLYAAILVGGYMLLMRPQRKRDKKLKEVQASIKTGDDVITSGGFFGRVADVGEDCFIIEFGTNRGIRIPVLKSDVLGIRTPKTTPPPKEEIEQT